MEDDRPGKEEEEHGAMARPLVGRDSELRRLAAALDDLVAGRGGLALLSGEAGIGKTRLAEELAERAVASGAEVHWATCWEEGGAPAYWPWAQLLRSYAERRDRATLSTEMGPSALSLLAIAPDLGPLLSAGRRPSGARGDDDPDRARFALFEAMSSLLRRAAARCPIMLVLDDLQWSDSSSLLLLRFVEREVRHNAVLMVGAYRDTDIDWEDERGRFLADVARAGLIVRLGGLDDRGVAELILHEVPGGGERPELVTAIAQRSGGNPLFVVELARLLAHQDTRRLGSAPYEAYGLPPETAAVLQRRFALLSQPCHDVLSVAAVVGQEFRADIVAKVTGVALSETLAALDEAVRARILTAPATPRAPYAFGHALMRNVLYEQLSPPRRAALHASVAGALEAAGPPGPSAATLAYHFLRAGDEAARAKGVRYGERAGREALDALAYEEAGHHFTAALAALELGDGDPELCVELLLSLGDAQTRAGDLPAARTSFTQAAAAARQHGLAAHLARAALGLGTGPTGFEIRLFDEAQVDLLEEALGALGAADSALRAWTMARLSVASSLTAPTEQRRARAEEALAIARRTGAIDVLAYALAAHCDAIPGSAHVEERLGEATEIIRLAEQASDRSTELLGRRLRLVALLERGDIAAADTELDAFARSAQSLRQPLYLWYVPLWKGMRALLAGRLAEAEARASEAEALGQQAHSANASMLVGSQRLNIALERGRPAEAEDVLRSMIDVGLPLGPGAEAWLAAIWAREGRLAEAGGALTRLVTTGFAAHSEDDAEWLSAACQLAEVCAAVGDLDAAGVLRDELAPFAERCAVDGIGAAWLGSTARYLGMLSHLLDDYDDAVIHFEHALDVHRRAGALLLTAHTLHNLGHVLLARAGHGDIDRGRKSLAQAAAIFRELGTQVPREHRDDRGPPAGTPGEEPPPANTFRRDGETWTLSYGGRTVLVRDSKGLGDVARLLASPGQEVLAAELLAAGEGVPPAGTLTRGTAERHGLSVVGAARGEAMLDDRARREYRQRLAELQEEVDEAEGHHDPARAEKARLEIEFITDQLTSSLGLRGRPRRSGDGAERARKAVTQRVRAAIQRLERDHPELGRHLDRSIRTGTYCSYAPERPTSWSL